VLQLVSAVVGSLVVAESSAEFQWAQKVVRAMVRVGVRVMDMEG